MGSDLGRWAATWADVGRELGSDLGRLARTLALQAGMRGAGVSWRGGLGARGGEGRGARAAGGQWAFATSKVRFT